jgi:uncharacterized repeat protein (TIGR03803 family)
MSAASDETEKYPLRSQKPFVAFAGRVAIAGVSSLALAAFTPLPTLAAPTITLKGTFDGTNGSLPLSAPTLLENGKFYGTTRTGGSNNTGVIYEFDPVSSNITLNASFGVAPASGTNPNYGGLTPTGQGNGTYYGATISGGHLVERSTNLTPTPTSLH